MQIDPLYIFVFFGLFSPGPNIILLTASGARFGFQRTIPHILGVAFGVGIIAALTGFGVGAFLSAQPRMAFALKCIAAVWILWMAWKLLNAARAVEADPTDRPFTFVEAVLFQWVNPKVWAVALAASAGYSAGLAPSGEALRLATAFSGLNLFVCLFWAFAGSVLAFLLKNRRAWSIFMTFMASVLALSAGMVFL